MLRVSGRVEGVTRLTFAPTVTRFRDVNGTPVIWNPQDVRPDAQGNFEVDLYSKAELTPWYGGNWQWLCTEHSEAGEFTFAFTADPAFQSYTAIRSLGAGL